VAVFPNAYEWGLLLFIAVSSFAGQILLNMSYQMLPASYAAGLSYVQVSAALTNGHTHAAHTHVFQHTIHK
jgi:drug/metabolite transporter (DMT)-like permease